MISKGNYHLADSLFLAEDYFRASIEYERLIFHQSEPGETNFYRYKKALCYKNINDYSRALSELQTIYFPNPTDSLYSYVAYAQALCLFLNDDALKALWKIDEFINRSHDSVAYRQFQPLKILCLNQQHDWENAKNELKAFIQKSPIASKKKEAFQSQIDSLYSKKTIPKIRSVKKAENLSRFIPGAGQVYVGKIGEGMVNFLINASILAFSAHQFYYKFYVTGYLAGLGMFNKTYHGGIKRAGHLAAEKNKIKTDAFNHNINALMIDNIEKK